MRVAKLVRQAIREAMRRFMFDQKGEELDPVVLELMVVIMALLTPFFWLLGEEEEEE